ncbi:MAG: ABC transporter permease, partial [Clostridiales bacterium]|nr:ABC transporter permease [Clostridiales bacterium]
MHTLGALVKRNIKLFFKDKATFFTSLITPLILLVLYITFLARVYRNIFAELLPADTPAKILNAAVGGQLLSSLLAVCCVTVAFCSNMIMVADKVTGARRDFNTSPVRRSTLALSYYIATLGVTLIVCCVAAVAGLTYVACIGWY